MESCWRAVRAHLDDRTEFLYSYILIILGSSSPITYTPRMPSADSLPVVAIVGRPNVGKSSLFNRLVGERRAITSPIAGTTRDRITAEVSWNGRSFRLMDTGGLDVPDAENVIDQQVVAHAEQALATADLVLFVVDARAGVTPLDQRTAELLRRGKRPVLLVANKAENINDTSLVAEFYALGVGGEPFLLSARHGKGSGDLLDAIDSALKAPSSDSVGERVNIAIVGRPNVGKSSLLNAITGETTSIVSEIAGTTRDTIDTVMDFEGTPITLVDTAGIRRAVKVNEELEIYSVSRARDAIERADVIVLVLDATKEIAKQDQAITARALEAGVGLIIAANKWDLLEDAEEATKRIIRSLHRDFVYLPWAPVVFTSATTGKNGTELLRQAVETDKGRRMMVDDETFSSFMKRLTLASPPPRGRHGPVKIIRAAQTGTRPPTFTFHLTGAEDVHFSYKRFLERNIREHFGFGGTPVRLKFIHEKR